MTDEQKESKIKVEDLPQPEQELTAEEAKEIKGGVAQTEPDPTDDRLNVTWSIMAQDNPRTRT